jgi:hypothetical protein
MMKIAAATPEEYALAQEANRLLASVGASVHAFAMHDPEIGSHSYRLTFQCGQKRTTVSSETPFHLDAPEDIVRQVQQWIASGGGERWTTDLERADAE